MRAPLTLLYHAVAPLSSGADLLERALVVPPATLARQMEDLAERGWCTLRLDEFRAAIEQQEVPPRRFLLTFDDAYADLDRWVTPILSRCGFSAVVFAPSAHLGRQNTWDAAHPTLSRLQIMTAARLKALDSARWEVESHGCRHLDLRRQPVAARRRELEAARHELTALLGREVRALAYPYGRHDASVRQDAREAGYRLAFTARGYGGSDAFQIARRAIQSWDRAPLFRFRTGSLGQLLYRVEDGAHVAVKIRHLRTRQGV